VRSDEDLIVATATDPDAFAELYRRHHAVLAGYFLRRTGSAEWAADLTAETFAAALHRSARYDPGKGTALMWLFGIAHRELATALERGAVATRARRRMRIPRGGLDDQALERVVEVATAAQSRVVALMEQLPAEQREAVRARVLEEREYADIALAAAASQSVIRKRVSRGLAALRTRFPEDPR